MCGHSGLAGESGDCLEETVVLIDEPLIRALPEAPRADHPERLCGHQEVTPLNTAIVPGIVVFKRASLCDLTWDVLSATAAELGDVRRGRIRILLDRFQVFLDHLQRGSGGPPEERADLKILVRVHFDVVDLRVPGHGRAGRPRYGVRLPQLGVLLPAPQSPESS